MAFRRLCCFLASAQPCNKNEIIILALTKKQEYVYYVKQSHKHAVPRTKFPRVCARSRPRYLALNSESISIPERDPILTAYLDEGPSRPKRYRRSLVEEGNWAAYNYDGDI
jgi:hypothetical protein